jgi:NAD(P)-dependent dehydrogenase (short-subunit alcohol dehydrogenase family)
VATTEHTINDTLAAALRAGRRVWRQHGVVSSENTGMLKGNNRRPDILVLESGVSPVAIETEVLPAITVEPEATSRLGEVIRTNGKQILSSVAVRLPRRLRNRDTSGLYDELIAAKDLEMALYTGLSAPQATRWPSNEWFIGGVSQLSLLTQAATVPPEVINKAADELVGGVTDAAGLIAELSSKYPASVKHMAAELKQEDGEQTRRMAATIIANAFVFHDSLAESRDDLSDVMSLSSIRYSVGITKTSILQEWGKILRVNYWPIFDVARRLVEHLPSAGSSEILERLVRTAETLVSSQLTRSHDLTGAVFQKLIADRKFLAAYYTTPSSAALLAGLAIRPDYTPNNAPWSDDKVLRSVRIADFACGTGTLLSATYSRLGQLHELAGGDADSLHRDMMAHCLVGCDVLPAAAHLTASMLAGAHPAITYRQSAVFTLAYGKQANGEVSLGSLDLIDPQNRLNNVSITAKSADAHGETERETWWSLPHGSFDLVIMNPPFTRATGHEGKKIGVHNPMFAAFKADDETQRTMGRLTKTLTAGTSAHGNAGEASIFLVLADKMLKEGGTVALVMPLSLMIGESWQESRNLLISKYVDITVISNAGIGGRPVSFSADTDMGECLFVGRKSAVGSSRATFVVLNERPESTSAGSNIASQIHHLRSHSRLKRLEDGPVGGVPIRLGSELIGQAIESPIARHDAWNLTRIKDLSLAQIAHQLAKGVLWLPTMARHETERVAVRMVGEIGEIGPYHADINGRNARGGARGPFDIADAPDDNSTSYPVLWSHDASRERCISFAADCEGVPRIGSDDDEQLSINRKLEEVWCSASHCHFNRDFRFNSQSTSMQFTTRKTIGGRAWLSINLSSEDSEKALVLWSNTTMGLLLYWWSANKQQDGRGTIGKLPLARMPVLDVSGLTEGQISAAREVFSEFASRELKPLNEIDADKTRAELDTAFVRRVLQIGNWQSICHKLGLVRAKMAKEPSVIGHKAAEEPAISIQAPTGDKGRKDTGQAEFEFI